MKNHIYILGINESHVASAALLRDGEIIACASEERFTRNKGQWGYPKKAIDYCLKEAGILPAEVDTVVFGFKNLSLFIHGKPTQKVSVLSRGIVRITRNMRSHVMSLMGFFPWFYTLYDIFYKTGYTWFLWYFLERPHRAFVARSFGKKSSDIIAMDHHKAHAIGAYYMSPFTLEDKPEPVLVVTNDGMGDDVCSRIYVIRDGRWKEIASTPNAHSLGWLYLYVTEYLGMKPNEHEYKVMGLAPYAHQKSAQPIIDIFRELMWVEGLTVRSKIPALSYYRYLETHLAKKRFDLIASGIQIFTEQILTTLVRNAIKKTNIHTVVLAGGVFMNVKANMVISHMPEVKKLFVMPSCGDESTAIGAAYYGYKTYCERHGYPFRPKPLNTLYLGPSYNDREIDTAVRAFSKRHVVVKIVKISSKAKVIAKLLSDGKIIARFDGRMEFGARALGNRSILANPSNREVIRTINDQIKGRDFWMPFAPVILEEYADTYLERPHSLKSPYMMIAFETKKLAKRELIAALHPYDYSARPQILERKDNPDYYDIVEDFQRLTGIGALLNTSFNIHGDPIVCSPEDALSTFWQSGLRYLLIGKYLLSKE
ncbi:MAG: carbamoyltransferase [Parcubacteria group bacterium]|nr:carbamoyltransferase [Parcubacteria group bacterium]